jgi:hypothetical protein
MYFLRSFRLLLATPLLFVGMCAAQGYPLVNTTTGTYDTQTPAYVGQGANHICWVDGVINLSTSACVLGFSGTGGPMNGIIQGYVETQSTNPFAGGGSWTWILPNGLVGTACPTGTVTTCELLNAPIVLGSGSDIIGVGIVTASQNYAVGTAFTFGSTFPSALGQPTLPTINCNAAASPAAIPAGTYHVSLVESNNLEAGTTSNTPGYTIASSEQTCTFSGASNSISIGMPTAQSSSNTAFSAVDDYLCVTANGGALGSEICGSVMNGSLVCATNGLSNGDGCEINSTRVISECGATAQNACLLSIPTSSGATQGSLTPPLKDLTNPMIVVGALKPTTGSSGNFLSRFSVMGNSTLGPASNFGVPATNEPNVGIWLRTSQENTILQGVGVFGPWGGYCTSGTGCGGFAITGGGTGIYVTKGSNQINGSESICIMNSSSDHDLCDPITVDGNMLFGSPQLGIDGTSMNTRQSNSTAYASALISGTGTKVTFTHSHFENSVNPSSGDLIQATNGATVTVLGGDGCCAVNGLHITSSALGASAVNFANTATNPVEDDLNGDPTVPTPVNYTSIASWDSGGVAVGSGHLNQVASKNFAGSCSMSTGTTCTFSITTAFTGTPLAFASLDPSVTLPTTANPVKCSVSGTTVTITAFTSNSLKWDCILIGNPN